MAATLRMVESRRSTASIISSVQCGPNLSLILFPALGLISQAVLYAARRPAHPLCASLTTAEGVPLLGSPFSFLLASNKRLVPFQSCDVPRYRPMLSAALNLPTQKSAVQKIRDRRKKEPTPHTSKHEHSRNLLKALMLGRTTRTLIRRPRAQ